jgi:hypothetical protein
MQGVVPLILDAAAGSATVGRLGNLGQTYRADDAEAAVLDGAAVVKPQRHDC